MPACGADLERGSGLLGLKDRAEAMGGRLALASRPGEGTQLTVELPLKTAIRDFSWTIIPTTWRNRKTGESKLKIKEMGSRYLFICLYLWLEKYFSRGDYRRQS